MAPKLFTVMGGNFKFQVQDSDLEYFVFWYLETWKTHRTFRKKPPLACRLFHNVIVVCFCTLKELKSNDKKNIIANYQTFMHCIFIYFQWIILHFETFHGHQVLFSFLISMYLSKKWMHYLILNLLKLYLSNTILAVALKYISALS